MRRAALLLLTVPLLVAGCGGSDSPSAPPTLPSLPPISLAPVGPADLSAPASLARLLGAYDGDACAPVTPEQVRGLTGVTGTVEFAVRAGTTIGTAPPASSTSCLYAAIASSVGLSLPSKARPAAEATYARQVKDAFADCPDRTTRQLTVVGLPGTVIRCASSSSRVLALRGARQSDGQYSSPTCAVLNAEQVDENRFLAFCADAFRRAADPALTPRATAPATTSAPAATPTTVSPSPTS